MGKMGKIAITTSRDLQRRLFRHMVALRIKELDTAATLAASLVNEPGGKVTAANALELMETTDALASTTSDAYAISDEVIDNYLNRMGERDDE